MRITDIRHTIYVPVPLEDVIHNTLLNALAFTNGIQKEAAQLLGISEREMSYKMVRYNIPTSGVRTRNSGRKRRDRVYLHERELTRKT